MKKLFKMMLVLVLALVLSVQAAVVPAFAWGIFKGDQDGNMHLEKNITRAEIAVLIANLKNAGESAQALASQTIPVKDFAGIPFWARGFVNYVYKQGILKGNDKGQFMPNQNITREELAVIMINLEGSPVKPWNENHKYFAGTKAEIKKGTLTRGDVKKSLEGWLESKIKADTKDRGKFVYEVLGIKMPAKTITAAKNDNGETLAESYSADELGTEYKKNRKDFKFPHKILMLQAGKDKGIHRGSFAKISPDKNFYKEVTKLYKKDGDKYSITLPLEQALVGGLTKTIRVIGNGLTREGQQLTVSNDSKMLTFRKDTGFPFVIFSEKPLDNHRLAEIVGDVENTKKLAYEEYQVAHSLIGKTKKYLVGVDLQGYSEYDDGIPMDPAKYAGMPNLMGVTNGYRKFEDGSKDNINVFPLAVTILNNVEYTGLTEKDYTIRFNFDEANYIQVPYNRPYVYLFGTRLDVLPKKEVLRLQKIAEEKDWSKPVEFKGIVARDLQLPNHERFIMQAKPSKLQQDFLREFEMIIYGKRFSAYRVPYSPKRFIIADSDVYYTASELMYYEEYRGGWEQMRIYQNQMDAVLPTFALLGQRPTEEPFAYYGAWGGDGRGHTFRKDWLVSNQLGFTSPLRYNGRISPYIAPLMSKKDIDWYNSHTWKFPKDTIVEAKNDGTDFLVQTLAKYTDYVQESTSKSAAVLNPVLISFEKTTERMNAFKDKLTNTNNPINFTMLQAVEGLIITAVE